MGSDPTDVHPEHDHPTADNIEEWSDEQLDAYKRAKEADLADGAAENRAELSREQQQTLERLRSAVDDEVPTETVEYGDAELVVQAKLTADIEGKIDDVVEAQESGRLANVTDAMIDVITALIVDDDEPEDSPVDYQDRAVWEAFHAEGGVSDLADAFFTVVTPAVERMDDLTFPGADGRGHHGRGAR